MVQLPTSVVIPAARRRPGIPRVPAGTERVLAPGGHAARRVRVRRVGRQARVRV